MPSYVWIILGVITLLVVIRALIDLNKKRKAREAQDSDLRDAQEFAEARERGAAWDAFEAEIGARQTALEENPTVPEFIISLLVGEDYPRYSVFYRVIETERYQQPYRNGKWQDGKVYPTTMPPETPPEVVESYQRATDHTFDDYNAAKRWFDLWIEAASRQTGIDINEDDTLQIRQGWGDMDAEGEAQD